MKLIRILSQNRRDFVGEYQCENCNVIAKISGYDDRHFHNYVMPQRQCAQCYKSTRDLGKPEPVIKTKYKDHEVV
jgi:hypothetical protein